MKDFFVRLINKITGHKALYTTAILAIVLTRPELSAGSSDVINNLTYAVLGAKSVQYLASPLAEGFKLAREKLSAERNADA